MKNYEEVLNYLYGKLPMFQRVGKIAYKKDLTNITSLCQILGDPQDQYPTIHIAGTNGKGSTSHILSALLQRQGLIVGLYTSPHYIDFRERVKINGMDIPEAVVVDFVQNYSSEFEKVGPSFFEWSVALAFYYFASENVDIAIIETGLGGRLDSTNIITPLLSVITNVGMDHMEQLGNTRSQIASEKAGIIKPNVPVVLGEKDESYYEVIADRAEKNNSDLFLAKDVCSVQEKEDHLGTCVYAIRLGDQTFRQASDLCGGYQAINIQTALAAWSILTQYYESFQISPDKVIGALSEVRKLSGMLGRWQVLKTHPPILLDGAHNMEALSLVLERFDQIDAERKHIVIGFSNDKDLTEVFNILPSYAVYYFCKADVPRGENSRLLLAQANQHELKGQAFPSVIMAFEAAMENATEFDAVLVTGSIFVVGEVLAHQKE